ncbi:MAG: hypothetical protein JWP41_805 [Ramlibacter sp.]|jgi:hypothetical protein|nr:hypothetical protein [Ramlibacter sp.]
MRPIFNRAAAIPDHYRNLLCCPAGLGFLLRRGDMYSVSAAAGSLLDI